MAFGFFREEHLLNDFGKRGGIRIDGAAERVAAEGAEADRAFDRDFARSKPEART